MAGSIPMVHRWRKYRALLFCYFRIHMQHIPLSCLVASLEYPFRTEDIRFAYHIKSNQLLRHISASCLQTLFCSTFNRQPPSTRICTLKPLPTTQKHLVHTCQARLRHTDETRWPENLSLYRIQSSLKMCAPLLAPSSPYTKPLPLLIYHKWFYP
jgi:hypothetical protein